MGVGRGWERGGGGEVEEQKEEHSPSVNGASVAVAVRRPKGTASDDGGSSDQGGSSDLGGVATSSELLLNNLLRGIRRM